MIQKVLGWAAQNNVVEDNMNLDLSGKRCLLFTRSNVAVSACDKTDKQQLAKLRAFARRRHLDVVGHVSVDGATASGHNTGAAISTVIDRKCSADFDVLLMTDLSRLSRNGVCHAMHLISRLAAVNVSVVTLDYGLVGNGVFNAFHLRTFRKKKGTSYRHEKKKPARHPADHHSDDPRRGDEVPVRAEVVDQGASTSGTRKT